MTVSAQLEVQSDGKVVINPTYTPDAQFTVNTSLIKGIQVYNTSAVNAMPPAYIVGVKGNSSASATTGSLCAFGLWGETAGRNEYGRNIGVLGSLNYTDGPNTSNGAGIAGIAGNWQFLFGKTFSQKYAGYFAGDVEITTHLTANGMLLTSDFRYKQNIADLRQSETNKLFRLNPVGYNLKQRYTEYTDSTGSRVQLGMFDESSQLFQKKHYGLIAQELREIYPDLVYEDGDGYLSVDYIGIIPLLISSVKELKAEIDELKRVNSTPVSQQNAPAKPQETTSETVAALYQNTPNPFNENTEIAFYLPQSVTNAMLCVYDMNGKQLSQNVITQRGSGSFVVNGNQYGAGMYLYSLIADNQLIDTKRMILTK